MSEEFRRPVKAHLKINVRRSVKKCQDKCYKTCQNNCEDECQKICQNKCQDKCQKISQKKCEDECQKVCQRLVLPSLGWRMRCPSFSLHPLQDRRVFVLCVAANFVNLEFVVICPRKAMLMRAILASMVTCCQSGFATVRRTCECLM